MPVIFQRLWIQLTADKKRFAVLCACVGVGLLMWARLIIVSNVPRTAVADPSEPVASSIGLDQSVPGTEAGSTSSRTRTPVTLDREPMRDPFAISARHFPQPSSEGSLPIPGKLDPQAAEEARARHLAALHELAGRFRLEAVMVGDSDTSGMAVINGRTWRPGQLLAAAGNEEIEFELVEVKPRSVLLRFEEHTFELNMPSVR